MILSQASFIQVCRIESQCFQSTAIKLTFIRSISELGFLRMKIAMPNEWTIEVLVTNQAVKEKSKAIDLIEDLLPTHISLFLQMQEKFLDVK